MKFERTGYLFNLQNKLINEISLLRMLKFEPKKVERKTKEQLVGLKTELGGQKLRWGGSSRQNKLLAQAKVKKPFAKVMADNIAQEV